MNDVKYVDEAIYNLAVLAAANGWMPGDLVTYFNATPLPPSGHNPSTLSGVISRLFWGHGVSLDYIRTAVTSMTGRQVAEHQLRKMLVPPFDLPPDGKEPWEARQQPKPAVDVDLRLYAMAKAKEDLSRRVATWAVDHGLTPAEGVVVVAEVLTALANGARNVERREKRDEKQ